VPRTRRRVRRALDDRCDLLERHREHVVQHEREPLRRAQRLKHDQQREPDRVGQQRFVLGIGPVGRVDDRVRHVHVQRLLAARVARAQHVQCHARHDRGQPRPEVLDLAGVGTAHPEPRVLDRVVRLAERPEHPVGHGPQAMAVLLEALGQPFLIGHVTFLRRRVSWN
jgi:hypothetical protein